MSLLPTGWKRKETVRKTGVNAGKVDIYITSPGGKSFRSKKSLEIYIKDQKLPYDINTFNFTTKYNKAKNDVSLNASNNSLSSTPSSEYSSSTDNIIQSNVDLPPDPNKLPSEQKNDSVPKTKTVMVQTESCTRIITTCAELLSKHWLTDQTIHSYLDILSTNILQKNDKILILDPSTVYGIKALTDYSHLLSYDDFVYNDY